MPAVAGYYINLDRSTARRAKMERQFNALGIGGVFARMPGVLGAEQAPSAHGLQPGEVGCFYSHLNTLKATQARGAIAHILEDDVILTGLVGGAAQAMAHSGQLDRFDMIFTDTFFTCDLLQLRFFKQAVDRALAMRARGEADFKVIDISAAGFSNASSYMVSPRALPGLIKALEDMSRSGGPVMAVDMAYRALANQGGLRVGLIVPFITSIELTSVDDTEIGARESLPERRSLMALALLRYALFVESDCAIYARRYLDLLPGPTPDSGDARLDLLVKTLGFIASDEFKAP